MPMATAQFTMVLKILGVAGVFVQEVAETKVVQVHGAAEQRGYPLRAGAEKE